MIKAFECYNVVKKYPDFKLGPLNFELEPGVVLAYVGPNGAGKTTTLHCLTGLVRPEEGEMQIYGQVNDPFYTDWKLDVGYVGDIPVFHEHWTAERNLRFLSQFYNNWSHDFVEELARKISLPLEKRAKNLSSGNRVKLSLISALAHSPKLLLLDEPTSGLDPVVRAEVLDTLFEFVGSGDRAILYSTHILSDVSRLADEIAFIVDGQIIQRQKKDDLIESWRQVVFTLKKNDLKIAGMVHYENEQNEHRIITSDFKKTAQHLKELSAKNIRESRMSIDDISVHILKNAVI